MEIAIVVDGRTHHTVTCSSAEQLDAAAEIITNAAQAVFVLIDQAEEYQDLVEQYRAGAEHVTARMSEIEQDVAENVLLT